jgi:hypothetical protein
MIRSSVAKRQFKVPGARLRARLVKADAHAHLGRREHEQAPSKTYTQNGG